MSSPPTGTLRWLRSSRAQRRAADLPVAVADGHDPEAFWDLHGSALYALACALLGDEAAALSAVSSAMVDLYSTAGADAEAAPDVTLGTAAASVYLRCDGGPAETPAARTMTAPALMVRFGEMPRSQRAALALCVFGGHTCHQVAAQLDLPTEAAADLLGAGLRDLRLAT